MSQMEFRPGLADVPAAESAVSFIDGKRARLEYRGIAGRDAGQGELLRGDRLAAAQGRPAHAAQLADFDDELRHHRRIKYRLKDLIKCLPETGHPMDALQASRRRPGHVLPVPATSPTRRATGRRSSA